MFENDLVDVLISLIIENDLVDVLTSLSLSHNALPCTHCHVQCLHNYHTNNTNRQLQSVAIIWCCQILAQHAQELRTITLHWFSYLKCNYCCALLHLSPDWGQTINTEHWTYWAPHSELSPMVPQNFIPYTSCCLVLVLLQSFFCVCSLCLYVLCCAYPTGSAT